jgi:AraC family transcriptional regulator
MDPVGKALWFIESHFAGDITLAEIAEAGGVSRYYMSRAFGTVTGHSAMRYLRGRRLTEAAKSLAAGAADTCRWRSRQATGLTRHSPGRFASSSG